MMFNEKIVYVAIKDHLLRYTYCNEALAAAAGLDAPSSIIGKVDEQLCWREYANDYQLDDLSVLQGQGNILNKIEPHKQKNNIEVKACVSKELINRGRNLKNSILLYFTLDGKPNIFSQFTQKERLVLTYLIAGLSSKQTGFRMHISSRTVEMHLDHIKSKLKVSSKHAILGKILADLIT